MRVPLLITLTMSLGKVFILFHAAIGLSDYMSIGFKAVAVL